jgi:hypothetical protein
MSAHATCATDADPTIMSGRDVRFDVHPLAAGIARP